MGAATLLPGACGGKAGLVFVGSSGGKASGGADGGQAGEGGLGGAASGGRSTGGGDTGGSGGTISAHCGNGEVDPGEDCDSGGEDSSSCNFDCTAADCGDGYINDAAREACDDGGESAYCDDDCTLSKCGDGVLNEAAGEECDDDNTTRGDGCSPDCEREILLIADGISEDAAADLLRAAGFAVAISPVFEYEYDGTSPPLDHFCGVIAFNGSYSSPMPTGGQDALTAYVDEGGAVMTTGWTATEFEVWQGLDYLDELILLDSNRTGLAGDYSVTTEGASHPLTANLPSTFNPHSWGESGVCRHGAISLISETNEDGSGDAVCVSDDPSRRVISVGNAFGHYGYEPLNGYGMATFFINAANWMCDTRHTFASVTPGSTEVVERFGYRAQCLAWDGDVCLKPYIAMAGSDITGPQPHCIDDLTTMRPVWGYELDNTAPTWCWIATGRSDVLFADNSYAYDAVNASGWMYVYDYPESCDTGMVRHLSTVDVPTIGPQVWSFDDFTWFRDGYPMHVTCDW